MNLHKTIIACAVLLAVASFSGCSTSSMKKQNETDIADTRTHLKALIADTQVPKPSNFTEQAEPSISIKPLAREQQEAKEKEWLTSMKGWTLNPAKNAVVPANEIMRMFRDKGLNIVTTMPLDLYSYNGFGVTNVNAETALIVFLGAMGLDFDLDNSRQLITVEPMRAQTWIINIGDRRTNFTASGDSSSASGTSSSAASPQASSPASGYAPPSMPGLAGSSATPPSPATSASGGGGNANGNNISVNDDMWSALATELSQRLSILVPKTKNTIDGSANVPSITDTRNRQMAPLAPDANTGSLYNTQKVGNFSINPVSGAVTVQAPKFILKSLDDYMTKQQEMYNTSITFDGELVTVSTSNNVSTGIDWSAFNNISNGAITSIVQNSILGGAVITPAAGTTSVANTLTIGNANIPGAGALFGIASATQKFAMFNAFLSSIGQLKIKSNPVFTTTSGTPVDFDQTVADQYSQFQQTAASGGVGSAAVASNTIYIPYKTGMTLRLNPRYDPYTGLVRTPFSLKRTILTGWTTQQNPISNGTTIQIINTKTPILADTKNSGELLFKNGDLIVVSVMTEDTDDNTDSGVTGLIDSPLKSLTGQGARNKTTKTYYFALRVTIAKRS